MLLQDMILHLMILGGYDYSSRTSFIIVLVVESQQLDLVLTQYSTHLLPSRNLMGERLAAFLFFAGEPLPLSLSLAWTLQQLQRFTTCWLLLLDFVQPSHILSAEFPHLVQRFVLSQDS